MDKSSDVLKHIYDYPEGKERICLYMDIMKQALNIFDLGLVFAAGLIKVLKKDKSWTIEKWSKYKIKKLLALLFRHVKADRIGKT